MFLIPFLYLKYYKCIQTILFVGHLDFYYLLNNFIYYFYFCLPWVFVAARRLSLVATLGATLLCGARASHCGGFSCCGIQALGTRASVVSALRL